MLNLFSLVNPKHVQQLLRGVIDRMFLGEIRGVIRNPVFYYTYYRTQLIALQLFVDRVAELYPEQIGYDGVPKIHDELVKSLNCVHAYAAGMAWLEVGEWRWHKEERYATITPDLHYGLVLRYPEPVMAATCYMANLHRTELEKSLSPEGMEHAERQAIRMARTIDSKFEPKRL